MDTDRNKTEEGVNAPHEYAKAFNSPDAFKNKSISKQRGAKPKVNRHSSLADIAREHKTSAQSTENDIRKFYASNWTSNWTSKSEFADQTDDNFPNDAVFRGHKHYYYHNHHHHGAIEYLAERNSSNLPEHSNFLYRTGSQVFANTNHEDLTQLPFSLVSHAPIPEHHKTNRGGSQPGSRQSSVPPSQSSSNQISREVSRTSNGEDDDDESFHSAYSSNDGDEEDALLFVGTRLRLRTNSSSSGVESISSCGSHSSQGDFPRRRNSVWRGIYDFLFSNTESEEEFNDLESISPYII